MPAQQPRRDRAAHPAADHRHSSAFVHLPRPFVESLLTSSLTETKHNLYDLNKKASETT
jgi:hypothetical protein